MRRHWTTASSLVLIALNAACAGRVPSGRMEGRPEDQVVFESVVRHLLAAWGSALRIDPRRLSADPGVVTLTSLHTVIPDRVASTSRPSAILRENGDLERRLEVLQSLDAPQGDILEYNRCPGVLVPPILGQDDPKPRWCPRTLRVTAIVSTPRSGGVYWPDNVDDRQRYAARSVYTARVIISDSSPAGSIEQSYDYVFECRTPVTCELLEVRPLLIVE